jgi:hypothetical protein
MARPVGVITIAVIFSLCAAYLCALAAIMLAAPDAISMTLGEPLIHDLILAGPYMFLLFGAVAALIAWGLMRMKNWARHAAIVSAFAGFIMLIPKVSAAAMDLQWSLVWSGAGIIVRMIVAWYLWQTPVGEQFKK